MHFLVGRVGTTFGGVLRNMVLRMGTGIFLTGRVVAGHLDNDLNPALIGDSGRKQLANGRGEDILTRLTEGDGFFFASGSRDRGAPIFRPRTDGGRHAHRLGNGLVVGLSVLQPIADVSNRQFITRSQSAHLHPLPIDPNAIGTPKVPDHDLAILLGHATVMARHAERVEPRLACRMAAHNHYGAIQRDVWTFIQGHKA